MKSRIDAPRTGICAAATAVAFVILTACAASGCKTAEFGHARLDVHGMVYDLGNMPVAGYRVTLDGKREAVSDAMGRYVIPSVPAGDYELAGSCEGYERYGERVPVGSRTGFQYLRVASADQLLSLAAERLAEGDIAGASNFVARAEKTGSRSSLVPFYAAVLLFRGGDPAGALSILESMEERGIADSAVSLMSADLRELTGGKLDARK